MRYQFSKSDQIAGGKISGRLTLKDKTGIHAIPQDKRHENNRRGGLTQGPIQGKRNLETGQLESIRNLPQTKAAQSAVGKTTGKKIGLIYGPLVDTSKIKTPESLSLGQKNGGPKSRHVRWHVNRNIFNPVCEFCHAAREKREIYGVAPLNEMRN